jgi:membrane protease YdiL (CAAX protease family)
MSNPLSLSSISVALLAISAAGAAATAPASAPADVAAAPRDDAGGTFLAPLLMRVLAVGVCVLAGWVAIRAARPRKLLLGDTPGRPNGLTILLVAAPLLGYLLIMAAAGVLTGLLRPKPDTTTLRLAALTGAVTAQVVWIAISLAVAVKTFRGGILGGLGLSPRRWLCDSLRAVAAYLAVIPICIGLLLLSTYLLPPGAAKKHDLLVLLHEVSPVWQPLIWLSAGVLAPLAEEIYFRGIMQSFIRGQTGRPWAAVVLAAAFFAAVHLSQPQAVASLFALALAMGYNYERTGRLISPILIHVIFNTVAMLAETS